MHVVAVQPVFGNPQRGVLIRIVAEPLSGQHQFIEKSSVTVLGVQGEEARQQADAVPVVDRAAILIEAAAEQSKTVTGFEGIDNVVIAPIVTAGGSDGFGSGRNRLLSERSGGESE